MLKGEEKNLRILIVASYAPSLILFRGRLIEDIIKRGHNVHVSAPDIEVDLRKKIHSLGATPHDVPIDRNGTSIKADLGYLSKVYSLIRHLRPEVVLAYTIKPVIWGLIAAWMTGVPKRVALITGLGYSFTGDARGKRALVQWVAKNLYRFSLRRATLIFFQNPDDRNDFSLMGLLPKGVPTVVVNGSGVDIEDYTPAPLPSYAVRFILIARLLNDKGIPEFVAAAAELKNRWPAAEFHIVGPLDTGPDAVSRDQIESWHQSGVIIWHGALDDVRPTIASAHVFVLPTSYREGTPRTILEAMAMGRAIITTDAPGCRETVVSEVNGFLIPISNIAALTAAMERFLSEPDIIKTMGVQARRIAEEKYDVRKVNATMLDAMQL